MRLFQHELPSSETFAVSGYIPISYNSDTGNHSVSLVQNKITIAGRTAPGDGIGLKDGRILITARTAGTLRPTERTSA